MSRTNATAAESRSQAARLSVLVVEDNDHLRKAVRAVLEVLDYEVEDVENADAALSRLSERPNRFDVLLTDVKMEGMSGAMLARKALALHPDLPVIFLSGLARNADLNMPDLRAFPLLSKPVSMTTLQGALKQAVDGRASKHPAVRKR